MKVFVVSGALVVGAAVASPLWAWGRPDRVWGFALGAAASLAKFAWSVRLARRLGESGARRYAGERVMGLALLGAALAIAGAVDGVDLPAAAVGVFLATVASVTAAIWETRPTPVAGPEAGARPSPDANGVGVHGDETSQRRLPPSTPSTPRKTTT